MQELTIKNYKGINVIDSREVAEIIDKKHYNLLRDIENYMRVLLNSKMSSDKFFIESDYTDASGKKNKCYLLTKQGCEMVANKMTGEKGILFTAEYVQAFNRMEKVVQVKPLTAKEELKLHYKVLEEQEEKIEDLYDRVKDLENNTTIDYAQQEELNRLANNKVVAILGGKDAPAYKELSKKAFSSFWRDYKKVMHVNTYKNTLVKDYQMGRQVICDWKPGRELELMIKGCNAQMNF